MSRRRSISCIWDPQSGWRERDEREERKRGMRERGRKDKKRWRGDEVRDEEVERGMREREEVKRRGQ